MFIIVILQHQNQSKTHIKMNKLLSLIIAVMMLAFQAAAQGTPKTPSSSQGIKLEITQYNNDTTGRHRTPMHINVVAFYNEEINTIDISYDGEADGEVYLYLNGNAMDYSPEITTSLQVPSMHGLYQVMIITETWIAQGYIQL